MKYVLLFLLLVTSPVMADELAVYWLNNMAVQYEGTGYRETPAGWELKVKPQSTGQGLRWRRRTFQLQVWRNSPYFSWEDGNSDGPIRRQSGQTRLAVRTLQADIRLPLAGSTMEALGGLMTTDASFDRKDVLFYGTLDTGARERLAALGPVLGFHAGTEKTVGRWTLWADGEVATARFLWTRNRLRTDGGSISQGGFAYLFRAEAGIDLGPWRLGLGIIRQMHEILVPGGKGLPNGAAASLPINKIDISSPFLSITRELP